MTWNLSDIKLIFLMLQMNWFKVFGRWKDIASIMRHRVFEDGEDFEIDKYDIQVSTLI